MIEIIYIYIGVGKSSNSNDIQVDVYESPRRHFRMRANFNVWHDDGRNRSPEGSFYAMYDETDKKTPCEIKGNELLLSPFFLDMSKCVCVYVRMTVCMIT